MENKFLAAERERQDRIQLPGNREQYRSLFDHHPDAVVALDLNGNFISANHGMARMAECSIEEVLKISFAPFIAPGDLERVESYFERAISGTTQHYTTGFISKKGNHLVVSCTLIPIIINGTIDGIYGIGKDITEEVAAKLKLKQHEEQLQKIMDYSVDMICTIDENRKFITVSKASKTVLGYTPEEMEGRVYIDFLADDEKEAMLGISDLLRNSKQIRSWNSESRWVRKDGKIISMNWSVQWDDEERISYCVGRDITIVKANNDRIKNSQKRFKALIENSAEGIILISADGVVLERSSSALNILELETNTIGRIDFNLLHPDDLEYFDRTFQEVTSIPNHVKTIEYRVRRKDDSYKWIEGTFHNQINEPCVNAVVVNLRDITERKEAARKIENNEKRFRSLLKNSSDGLALYSHDGFLFEISETGRKIIRYTEEEVIGKRSFELIHKDDLPIIRQAFLDVLNEEQLVRRFEFRLLIPDGSYIWIEAHFQNHLHEPAVNAMVINFRDITPRILASKALETSEDRYRRLFYNNPLPMWIYEMETYRFLEVNQAAIEKYGYSEEEFLKMKITDIRPKQDIELLKTFKGSRTKYGVRYDGHWHHLTKDGRLLYVDISSQLIDYKDCKANLILVNDVSEKILAENALKVSEQRFKALVQEGSDLINIIDFRGNYKYSSPAFASLIGLESDQVVGKNGVNFIHDDDREMVCKAIWSLKENKRVKGKPYRIRDCNGEYRWLESIATNLSDDPSVNGIVVNSRDITDNINYLRTIEEQNLRLKEIGWLQSHVVRAPLSRIMGIITVFKEYPDTIGTEELLNSLTASTHELDQVIRDIVVKKLC